MRRFWRKLRLLWVFHTLGELWILQYVGKYRDVVPKDFYFVSGTIDDAQVTHIRARAMQFLSKEEAEKYLDINYVWWAKQEWVATTR